MQLPERFSDLPDYAFPRLRKLLDGLAPGGDEISMSIGEPRHALPDLVAPVLAAHLDGFGRYPVNDGSPDLLAAISDWIARRYGLRLDPEREILALNGTREGLFNAALALSPEWKSGGRPVVLMPNPFYQAYGAAARAVGAEPVLVSATAATGFLPDYAALPDGLLARTSLCYVCSPSNPQGAVADAGWWRGLIDLAERHDFAVLADECYSEIWRTCPPAGALEVARAMGADPERVVIFHSLSKRSSVPGLRSGFAAGGPRSIAAMRQLRAYAGAPPPTPLQAVAAALWRDEAHVAASRALYVAKFEAADAILGDWPGYVPPQAGFFLWLPVPDGEAAARALWIRAGVKVLPGAYLGRLDADGVNPGAGYVRAALVASRDDVVRGLAAIRDTLGPLSSSKRLP